MENKIIKAKAKYCRLNESTYLRKMITDGYIITFDVNVFKTIGGDMNKIGNNINQIARAKR